MGSSDYRYQPWTEERRKRASEAAKRRWAEKRNFVARSMPSMVNSSRADLSFGEKFATGNVAWQHDLMRAWLNLIDLYRKQPSDPEFMKMLADCWEDMANVVAEDMRSKFK